MNKSILVIDTPKSCQMCKMCGFGIYDEEPHCKFIGTLHKYDFMDSVSPQCPLQDTTELLEALELLDDIYYKDELSGKPKLKRAYTVEEFSNHQLSYNKLYKALGGNNEEL